MMQVEAGVRGIIRAQKGEDELRDTLKKNGYVTLFADGLLKCEQGLTSTEEVLRNSLRVE